MATGDIRLLSAVEAIYDAALEPSKWQRAISEIVAFFGDVGGILQWRKDDGSFGTIATESLARAQRDYVEGGWSRCDLKALRAIERGYFFNGVPFCDRHVCTDYELANDPFCTSFLSKHGLGWFGAIAVSPDPHIGVLLSIQRNSRTKPQYTDSELEVLADFGRHVEKSLRLSIRLFETKATSFGLGDALARIDVGAFVLDALGRVVFSNAIGQLLVGDLLDLEKDRLRLRQDSAQQLLEGEIARALVDGSYNLASQSRPIVAHSMRSDGRYTLYLLPMAGSKNLAEDFLSRPRAVLLVIEQKIGEPTDPTIVRDLLGLTLGEARVAALVGSGLSPKDAATRLGIAHETARNVLKRVFSKVRVSRQSELAALLAKITLG